MNNALLYLGGILITALAVLFAVPRFVDWNSYRGVFEEEASRILGREVRVGGAVNVRLLPAPFVSFEKLRIADIGDEGGNSIIRVDSFTMWLSVPPLLRGVLEAHRVEVRRPIVNLAINAEGSGNWRTLAVTPGAFPFAPKEVALQSVEIHDGAVVVAGPSRNELARFDAINGELNAEALEGPFKFRGRMSWNGAPRQIKLATAKIDGNGDLRFKAAVDVTGSANSYVLDGKLSDLKTTPTLDGDLTAKLALGATGTASAADSEQHLDLAPEASTTAATDVSPSSGQPPAAAPTPSAAQAAAVPGGFELKSKVKGTTLGVHLADITISLEAGVTPQLITGQAKFGWADETRLDVNLASQWLDLDKLTRPSDAKMPLDAGRAYFEALAAALPLEAETNAQLEFDQLTLGGEPISNVRLAASRSEGPLTLKGVRADLPGGVRLELDGILTPTSKTPRLDGTLFLSGKSLMRFLAWGLAKPDIGRDRNDGPFSLDGQFALGDGTLSLTDAAVKFAGTPLEGDVKLDLGDRKKLAMAIEGPRIDVAQIGPGLMGLNVLRDLLFGPEAPAAESTAAAQPDASVSAIADLSLDLKVAQLVDGDRVLDNVDANLRLERGKLSIPRLRFSTPEGLYVDAAGDVKDVPARPQGSIRGLIAAPNAAAARAFVSLLGVDDISAATLDRFARLAPLRLAGTLKLAGGESNASTLALDGTLGGGRLTATLRLDGGRDKWRTSPIEAQATFDSPDVATAVATLFDAKIKGNAEPPKSGQVVVKAAGVPAEGLLSLANVTADGLSLDYQGKVRLPAPGETGLDGDLQIATADARVPLALAGLTVAESASGVPLDGTVRIHRGGNALRLEGEALALGNSTISGQVGVTTQDSGRRTIAATLSTNKASFATLLAPLLGTSGSSDVLAAVVTPGQPPRTSARQTTDAEPAEDTDAVIWPEQSFDLSLLDRVDGTVDIRIGSLAVETGLSIGNARVAAQLSPEGIKVTRLEGDAVGGRLTSEFDLTKAPAGVGLNGSLRIDVSSKAVQAEAGQPGDAAAFNVTFSSRALSPAAVLSALTGKGELTIGDATLNGNSPTAVSAVARAALTGQGPSSGAGLSDAVRAALKQGEVKLGKITVPVDIGDGALKLGKVQIELNEGRSTFETAVELATMKIDSEWQIEPKLDKSLAPNPTKAFLPPVTVVYAGKLNAFSTLTPSVSTGPLERELVVRKMELDVGELERLRKMDQERARQDAERRKSVDEEQARIEAERRDALENDQAPLPIRPEGVQREELPAPGNANGTSTFDDDVATQPANAQPDTGLEAETPPAVAPSPTSQRPPPRRKRPVEDAWRPFQTPY